MAKARWGMGMLNVDKSAEALPTEVMADFDLGIFYTKGETGTTGSSKDVISYSYLTRMKQAFLEFKKTLNAADRKGDLVKLDIGDRIGPAIIELSKPYGLAGLTISEKELKFIQFCFDIEAIERSTGMAIIDIEPIIDLSFVIAHNSRTEEGKLTSVSLKRKEINSRVFIPNYDGFDVEDENVDRIFDVETVTIRLPEGLSGDDYRVVLHSLFVAYEEVG